MHSLFVRTIVMGLALLCAGVASAASFHGDWFPNVVLTDQDGRKHKFYDDVIKDKVVALNFIYTKCTDVCPTDTAQMLQVSALLGDRVGKDIFFYSISIDPDNDTPAVLRRYKEMFGIGSNWTFLTGNKDDVALIQRKLGMIGARVPSLKEHNTSLIVGNEKTAQWIKRSPYDHPKILANLLSNSLNNFTGGGAGLLPFSAAPEISNRTRGDVLFRSRCMACHTVGEGDKLGPDLAGVVARRDHDWLVRWLKEPDKMIAEGDPIAVSMKAAYRNLPMPNLGLNDTDAAALIEFLQQEDARLAKAADHKAH